MSVKTPGPMTPEAAKKILAEVARRKRVKETLNLPSLLFGAQRAFVEDPSPLKAAVCTRRAGKTYGLLVMMLHAGFSAPRVQIPYVTKTKGQAKRIVWLAAQNLSEKLNLGLTFNRNTLTIGFPNGSLIDLIGCDDEGDIDKLRGGAYPLAVLDEVQSFRPHVQDLVEDILEPAMLDYRGTIVMTGTPNATCSGYYFDHTTLGGRTVSGAHPSGWSVHHWSVLDNPHLPHAAEYVASKRQRLGPDNPTFLREWEGKWVFDGDKVMYRLDADKNIISAMPDDVEDIEYVLGLDIGYVDSTAFVVLAFSPAAGRCWVVESYQRSGLIPSAAAAHIEALRLRFPFTKIVADEGGLGKGYAEEWRQRFGIPVEAAQKKQKLGNIELLNGDLRAGTLQIVRRTNEGLIDEMRVLQWNERRKGPQDKDDDHLTDALLYGWRTCQQWLLDTTLERPTVGSEGWLALQELAMEDAARSELEDARNLLFEEPHGFPTE